MSDFFLIAKIVSVSGNDGFVKIKSFSDFPERFNKLEKVYIDFFNSKKEFTVEEVKLVKGSFIIKFKNFNTAKDVEVLINKDVFINEEMLVDLPENTFFIHDLIESKVYQNKKFLGTIKDVLQAPANDIYVVISDTGDELLLPAISSLIEDFDKEKKVLLLKPDFDLGLNDEN